MNLDKKIRVRFAPSPTGHLHIGGLRTALFNWLFARHHGGAFLLRIEDTDYERSTQEYRDSILHSFAWTHLEHDEEIVTQSERILSHQKVAHKLLDEKKAYRCYCTPEDLLIRHGVSAGSDIFIKYDGYCRNSETLSLGEDSGSRKNYVIRFKLPQNRQEVSFYDLIKGTITFNLDQFDDFIILRSAGFPMYNFVVVVDDAFMGITHVIRGEEHLINTPKQILLYEACGYAMPEFAHLPLILGPSGEKLSKRDGATSVIEYRKEGYIADALLNYLARLGWSHGDQEIFSLSELIEHFSLDTIGKKGAIFDFEKLAWINSVYIKEMTPEQILDAIIADIHPTFMTDQCLTRTAQEVKQAIALYKERVKTLKQMAVEIGIVFNGALERNNDDIEKWILADTRQHLDLVIINLEKQEIFTHDTCATIIKELAAQLNIKLVSLLQPIRLALLGKASGPGVFDLFTIIGKEDAIERLRIFKETL